jgi:hypothetical protein
MEPSPAGLSVEKLVKIEDWTVSAYRSVNGGGTGEEFTENLKKEGNTPGNKWYDCSSGETWIQADFKEPHKVILVELRSANDCPERDPYEISFFVKYTQKDELELYEKFTLKWEERYQIKKFKLYLKDSLTCFKIIIHKNRSLVDEGNWGSGTQLCEVIFYEYSA